MERVAVIGSGGAGKSSFARRLSEVLGLPLIHLDRLFWKPGWIETPHGEWRAVQTELVKPDRWVIDGNYGATLDIRVSAADTVVFFDFPRGICIRRALWRSIRHHGKEVQAQGCPERIDLAFFRWIWSYPKVGRTRIQQALHEYAAQAEVIVFRSPRDVQRWLDRIKDRRAT